MREASEAMVWERRDCVSAEVDDSLVLLDLDTLLYHSLNKTAAATWRLLEQPKSTEELVDELCRKFEVQPEHCRTSLQLLLSDLREKQLLTEVPRSAAREQVAERL